jgi:hypothetical protein
MCIRFTSDLATQGRGVAMTWSGSVLTPGTASPTTLSPLERTGAAERADAAGVWPHDARCHPAHCTLVCARVAVRARSIDRDGFVVCALPRCVVGASHAHAQCDTSRFIRVRCVRRQPVPGQDGADRRRRDVPDRGLRGGSVLAG